MKLIQMPKLKIPILSTPDTPLTSTTQDNIPVAEIADDIVLHKDGSAALIIESSSLNFSLLSEKEQQAVIAAYAALLNSLSFAIQIVIRTQRKDITSYIKNLDEGIRRVQNPKLATVAASYRKFILESIKKKNVLGKKFYIVIPFSSLELGITKSFLSATKRNKTLPFPKSYIIKKAKVVLYPRRDHLIRQAGRLGLKLRQLKTNEITEVFYTVYNPEVPAVKKEEGALS